jgi:hypothetical protein
VIDPLQKDHVRDQRFRILAQDSFEGATSVGRRTFSSTEHWGSRQ